LLLLLLLLFFFFNLAILTTIYTVSDTSKGNT